MGGGFTSYNGTTRNSIARVNVNGSLDAGFNPGTGFNGVVYSTSLQSDGKIIVGGEFTSFNGTPRSRIARLNADGTLDASFNPGTGFDSTVRSTSLQPDGKIIVGGQFTSFNGTTINHIARLNADGTLDTGFNVGSGFNSTVFSITLQLDGKIMVGGQFTSFDGTPRNNIVRLNADGSLDAGFNAGPLFTGTVRSTSLQPDGKIIVGGGFSIFDGTNLSQCIARLNADGSRDAGFNAGVVSNGSVVYSTHLLPDGKIIVGGDPMLFNGMQRYGIVRLNTNGSLDAIFNPNVGGGLVVYSTSLLPDGKIIAGGNFSSLNGAPRSCIGRLNADGSLDASFNHGAAFNNHVYSTSLQPDGKIIAGGNFTTFNGTFTRYIARLNSDGTRMPALTPGFGFTDRVRSTSLQPDGKIIVGGEYTFFNGTSRNYIARLNADGSLDAGFNPGTGFDWFVFSTSLQPDGKIIVGGHFTSFNGTPRNRIVRLNADGSLDTGFNPGTGFNNAVRSITLQPDGKIIVGGDFTSFNGTTGRNRIVRLNADGSLDSGFIPGTGFQNAVFSTTLQPDGKIIVGGNFTSFNGTPRTGIARLNADGSLDTGFNPGTGFNSGVRSTRLLPDGKIMVGGGFTSFNGTPRTAIALLNADGSLDASFNPGTGFNGIVWSTSLQPDGKIIMGGEFTSFNGTIRHRIARLLGSTCNINISSVTPTHETCPNANNGGLTVVATCSSCTNGAADIRYSINNTDFSNTTGIFTGLADGTYTIYVRDLNNITCTDTDGPHVINAGVDNTVGLPSSTPTLCINTSLTDITHSTTGATGIGTATGLPNGVSAAWVSNIITLSGTPSVSGTFNYSIPLTGGCGSIDATGTITVSPLNTVGTPSSTPTLCINTSLTNITHSTTGTIGIGGATGLPIGVSAAWSSNMITISGTPSVSGTFNYSIPLTGGCGSVNATGTITVSPLNTSGSPSSTPTVIINTALSPSITHTTTSATGIGTATGLPTGVSAAWSSNSITISGTPSVLGTFNYSIPLTGGCGIVNATGTITVNPEPPTTLGTYPNTSVVSGTNIVISPSAAPTGTTSAVAYTNSNFTGLLTVNPTTGAVTVTGAKQAGTFTVTVQAFGIGTATTTFTLTVTNPICSQGLFTGTTNISVGTNPILVAIGDFNGDGNQDFATTNDNASSVSIRLGNGLGEFSGTTNVSVGSNPRSVAFGDFNGDGIQDFAAANHGSGTVSIRLGNGLGGFSGTTNVSVDSGPRSVAIGDFNGDGRQDFATANEFSNTVSIRLGNGSGGFSGTTNVSVGSGPLSVAIGDFNGDGNQDFAVANAGSTTVSIRLGNGSGGFSGTTNIGVGSSPFSVAIGDFNGDGNQDFAAANYSSNTVSIRLGNGSGGFSGSTNIAVGTNPYSVAIGDFNGDGNQDFAAANQGSASVSIRLGNGSGGFSGTTEVAVGATTTSVAIGDFNGDGKHDFATANYSSNIVSIRLASGNEINVQGNAIGIADGDITPSTSDHTDFGSVNVGSNLVRTYTIQNTGTTSLTASSITMTGGDAAMFTIGALTPASPIPSLGSATFTVTFTPASAGLKTATITINNDDCDEAVYDFALQGTGAIECVSPTITCPANISVNNIPNLCNAAVNYTATVTGNPAAVVSYTFSGATTGSGSGTGSGSTFNKGVTTVTINATNVCGNVNCSFDVTVVDTEAPITPTIANATGECSVTVSAPTTTDVCAGTITGTTTDPLTYNTQGTYTITWTFNDGNGNSTTAMQTVIVDDVTAPVTPTIANAMGECSVTVTAPTTTDVCAGTITGTTTDPLSYS
ncbi:MAG: VCBS repeat-containing protein [Saprospiraceae bacterium]|nr:VCBS repeat-containing protein [Saprospiraceae bacterium]